MGILVGLTAGLYVALNLLGAGGGRPNSASTVQVVNATLCAIWFFSASFGGSVLNKIGPAITACLGVLGYIIYVGSLWYFDSVGKEGFPIFAGVAIGVSQLLKTENGFHYNTHNYPDICWFHLCNHGLHCNVLFRRGGSRKIYHHVN